MTSVVTIAAPWEATLSTSQHSLISYFLTFGALALSAGFVRTYVTRGEVGARYRASTVARLGVMGIASLGYVLLLAGFLMGYDRVAEGWAPNAYALNSFAPRYMDWSLTVPLLCAELLAVTTLVGIVARRTQFVTMGSAFLMIFLGFLGAIVVDDGTNASMTALFFLLSTVFWIITTAILIRAVRSSLADLTSESATLLTQATILLLVGWAIYPIISSIQIFAAGGEWTTTIQIGLSVTDVVIKVAFGGLIHRVAKLRTAEDVRAGDDIHSESIWISSVKQSDAGMARKVYLPESSIIHPPRSRPPDSSAIATDAASRLSEENNNTDL